MNWNRITLLAATTILASNLFAVPILTLTPSGTASGTPGTTTGWGFSIDNDTAEWIVINAVAPSGFNPSFGVFTELAVTNFYVIAPNSVFTQLFDQALNQGLAKFDISALAVPGTSTVGTFDIGYDTFSSDPLLDGGAGFISGLGAFPSITADVDVTDAVPEPTTLALAGTALLALVAARRRNSAR